jgi:hypothetical protein
MVGWIEVGHDHCANVRALEACGPLLMLVSPTFGLRGRVADVA